MGSNPFFAGVNISLDNRFNDHIVVLFRLPVILISKIRNQTEADDGPNPHPGFDEVLVF